MLNFDKKNIIGYLSLISAIILLIFNKYVNLYGYFLDIFVGFSFFLIIFIASKYLNVFQNIYQKLSFKPQDNFIKKILNLAHQFLLLFFIGLLIPDLDSFFANVLNKTIFSLLFFLTFKLALEFYNSVRVHRQRKSIQSFSLIVIAVLLRFLLDIVQYQSSLNEYIVFSLKVIKLMLFFFIITYSLTFASNNNWIHYLARKDKSYLFWSMLIINFVLVSFLLSFASRESDGFLFFESQLAGSPVLLSSIIYFLIGVSARFSATALFSFSSTEVVEKKQTELSTITYLNNVITKTKDIQKVLDVIAGLTKNYTGASLIFGEIYAMHLDKTFKTSVGIDEKLLIELKKDEGFLNLLSEQKSSLLINSIRDFPEYNFINRIFPVVNSFIYLPIVEDGDLIGSLLTLHHGEYFFEGNEVEILGSFSDNLKIAIENSKLDIEIREKERLQSELKIAKQMQESLLPAKLQSTENYDFDGFSIPAEEVGGDFFDEVTLKNGNLCLIQGDVSGKGIGSSFFMAQIKGIAMALAKESNSGHELLCKINSTLYGNISKKLFVTMALLEFDNLSNKITYLRAGHTPIAVLHNDEFKFLKPKGIGIGFVNSNMFDKNLDSLDLECDAAICFTDGINELRNSAEQDYGFERIEKIIRMETNSAKNLNKLIIEDARDFAEDTTQHDDMTVISIIKKVKK